MLISQGDAAGVAQVVDALERIEAEASRRPTLYQNDGVACFDYLYTLITRNVLRCVSGADLEPADPRFADPGFIACLDVAFANRYLAAMGCGAPPPFPPRCWQTLLDHRQERDLSPLIFAAVGVNAHVNFDLPFALVTTCETLGRELDSGTHHADYQGINAIFANHMRQLRRHFENRIELDVDKALLSKLENAVGDLVVTLDRDLAWKEAAKLWRVRHDEAKLLRRARALDRRVAAVSWALFELDRIPTTVFRGLDLGPGPLRRKARRNLARARRRGTRPAPAAPAAVPAPVASKDAEAG